MPGAVTVWPTDSHWTAGRSLSDAGFAFGGWHPQRDQTYEKWIQAKIVNATTGTSAYEALTLQIIQARHHRLDCCRPGGSAHRGTLGGRTLRNHQRSSNTNACGLFH